MNLLIHKVEDIDTRLTLINERSVELEEEPLAADDFSLPLQDINDLQNFDKRLTEENGFFQKMVNVFCHHNIAGLIGCHSR